MKNIIIPIIALFFANALLAQQEPQFTQNNGHNAFLVNPAAVGSDNRQLLRFFVRQNWAFFNDAPITLGASYQALLKDKHGVGGLIYMDRSGPFRVFGMKASYAFHIPIDKKSRLSLGLSGKFYQNSIRTEDLVLINQNDLSIDMAQARGIATTGDAEFGLYYYSPRVYAGISSANLVQSRLNFSGVNNAKLFRHYFAVVGAKFPVKGDDLALEPFVNFRMINNLRPQLDAGLQFNIYNEQIKAGLLYRTSGYASIFFAASYDDNFLVSFSVDFIVNGLAKYGALNYESVLGYNFIGNQKLEVRN
jgi:type IX secretion system PorP/SprF family membrane protein